MLASVLLLRTFRDAITNAKNAPAKAGASSLLETGAISNVQQRTAKFIVHAQGDHVDVWLIRLMGCCGAGWHREGIIRAAHKKTVIFNPGRPVRCKAVFEANADGPSPAGRGRIVQADAADVVACRRLLFVSAAPPFTYRSAAFQAYPIWPGEETQTGDLRRVSKKWVNNAYMRNCEEMPSLP